MAPTRTSQFAKLNPSSSGSRDSYRLATLRGFSASDGGALEHTTDAQRN